MKDRHNPTPARYPRGNGARPSLWWWLGQLLLTAAACFFVFFGISLLAAAYRLNDPFSFIMTFFAACLITLISGVMVLGFVIRMCRVGSRESGDDDNADMDGG